MKGLTLMLALAVGGLTVRAAHEDVSLNDLAGFSLSNDFWIATEHVSGTACESRINADVLYSSLFVRSHQSSAGGNLTTFPPVGFMLLLR